MKKAITIFLILILSALIWQFYQLYLQHSELEKNYSAIDGKLTTLNDENAGLRADLLYFAQPENLEKELRSKFNYKKVGEKLIIVVPSKDN